VKPLIAGTVLLAVLLVLPKPACAVDNLSEKIKKDQQTLEKLKREIEENKRRSGEAQRKEASVLQSIEEVDHQLKRRREEVARVTTKLKQKDHELDATSSALFRLRNRIEERQDSIRSRLRVMYKEGPAGDMKLLLESRDSQDLLTRYAMLRWIARREYHMLEGYRADLNQMESTNAKIRQVRGELLSYKQETAEKLTEVRDERTKKDRLLTRVRSEKVLYEKVAGELEKSAQRLETLLREFEAKRKSVGALRPGSTGEGLGKLKGRLGWPSEGEVVSLFGRQKHPKFETYVQRKGIEIRAVEGSVIRSVFEGVVAFADWMRGYGLLAIVDHGEGYFTLYAHASKLLVNVGDAVRSNQPIGEIGDTGLTGQSTLYFEVRQKGEALDPLAWLAKRR
jgi:septal ring factor EnvC (AmiA/AmiB activator)